MNAIDMTHSPVSVILELDKCFGPEALPASQRIARPSNRTEIDRSDLNSLCHAFMLRLCSLLLPLFVSSPVFANDGQPVAIRYWPNNCVSIETMWNFHIAIGLDANSRQQLPRTADVEFIDDFWEASQGSVLVLDRKPNDPKPTLNSFEANQQYSKEAVRISRVALIGSGTAKELNVTSIQVDGVSIMDCKKNSVNELIRNLQGRDLPSELRKVDVLLLEDTNAQPTEMQTLAELLKPRIVLLRNNCPHEKIASSAIETVEHNTIAVSKMIEPRDKTRWVKLGESAWKMKEPLLGLVGKKESACQASRLVFKELSPAQMNFDPANGTHTPRWNAEHMMGRELLFFSQIYNAVDPIIPVMDLNPKQMPADYQAAHSDWTGAEEAMQMERVDAFTRRFAYLLDGMKLDEKAKGSSFWTPRALLLQMEKHYSEHTANVVKKKLLADWPKK